MAGDNHHEYAKPDPTPLIICLILAIVLCLLCFFIGVNIVKLWFYKGALGPVPPKYVIAPLHRKEKAQRHSRATSTGVDLHDESAAPSLQATAASKRKTVFPAIQESSPENPFSDEHAVPSSKSQWLTIPTIQIEGADDPDESDVPGIYEEFEEPEAMRKHVRNENRWSHLDSLEHDDCGDGSAFGDVPYATEAVERSQNAVSDAEKTLSRLGLHQMDRTSGWLTTTPDKQMQAAREKLLDSKKTECVLTAGNSEQAIRDSKEVCAELLDMVVHQLCNRTARFYATWKHGGKYVRDPDSNKGYAIARPFEYDPIEICSRMAGEDFCIFTRNEFTQKWYLQASATTFPAGWHMSRYIGKSLDEVTNHPTFPFLLWAELPDILDAIYLSQKIYTRTSTFIQVPDTKAPLYVRLFIQRPEDLFYGTLADLHSKKFHVRREFQTFRQLPKTGAVVMSTRTEFVELTEIVGGKKMELFREIEAWDEAEGMHKGRTLVEGVVRGYCVGEGAWRDDVTVLGEGD